MATNTNTPNLPHDVVMQLPRRARRAYCRAVGGNWRDYCHQGVSTTVIAPWIGPRIIESDTMRMLGGMA